jgi:hypothetical protein
MSGGALGAVHAAVAVILAPLVRALVTVGALRVTIVVVIIVVVVVVECEPGGESLLPVLRLCDPILVIAPPIKAIPIPPCAAVAAAVVVVVVVVI